MLFTPIAVQRRCSGVLNTSDDFFIALAVESLSRQDRLEATKHVFKVRGRAFEGRGYVA